LRGELNAARSAAAEEGVADTHVAGGGEPINRVLLVCGIDITTGRAIWGTDVRNKIGHRRVGEVRVIENVEELGPDLQCTVLSKGSVLEYGKVKFFETRSDKRISPQIAEMPGTRNAIRFRTVARSRTAQPRARRMECPQIN